MNRYSKTPAACLTALIAAVLAAFILFAAGAGSRAEAVAASSKNQGEPSNVRALTGTWQSEGGTVTGKSGGSGDVFAISDVYIEADDLFVYEATITSVTDNPDFNASLIFGLKNPDDPKERFYDFGVMTGSHRFIRFDQTNGYPESGVDVGALAVNKNTYRVKIVRNTADEFEYFIDGTPVLKRIHPDFTGGYAGMMTNDNGTYEDVKFTFTGKAAAGGDGFVSDIPEFTKINGSWKKGAAGLTAVTAGGDTWAYAKDMNVPADVSFVYEADVVIREGNHAAGILFGVQSPESGKNVPARLYSFLIARGDGNVMVFTHKNGTAEWIEAVGMNGPDRKAENYHMKMVFLASGDASFYVNGTLYKTMNIPNYDGGCPGLMVSAATTAIFNNISFKEVAAPSLEGLTLEGAELDSPFNPKDHVYWSTVPYSTKEVTLTVAFDSANYEAESPQTNTLKPGVPATFSLNLGHSQIPVTVNDKATGVSAVYTLNIVREPDPDTLYKEVTRPKYHFTPYTYQMNDPNGLVYNASTGEYHLFFQCNRPFDTGVEGLTGTTSWGHAVSTDLIHWEELPLALLPDELGMAWSGSAVIDYENTSGLFDDTTPPDSRMVLFYAAVGGSSDYGYAKESMAYSKDGGRTFIKYEGNPVVRNPGNMYGGGLRDPRVFRYENEELEGGAIWVMVTVGDLRIFTSRDLINWKHCGRPKGIDGKVFDSECPDLYPLPVDGDPGNTKWVYTGGGIFYVLGHMEVTGPDSVMFVPETEKIYALNGIADQGPGNPAPETYATQTFSSEKYGRRVSISWLRDPSLYFLDKHWNSAQSIPVEHSLRTVNGEVKLFSYPVKELEAARGKVLFETSGTAVNASSPNILEDVRSTCCDLVAVIDPGNATELGFKVRVGGNNSAFAGRELVIRYDCAANKLYVDKMNSGNGSYLGVYEPSTSLSGDGKLHIRIMLDEICFDVYGNDGEAAVAGLVYAEPECDRMEFFTNGDSVVESLTIYDMNDSRGENGSEAEPSGEATPAPGGETDPEKPGKKGCGSGLGLPAAAAVCGISAAASLATASLRKGKKRKRV